MVEVPVTLRGGCCDQLDVAIDEATAHPSPPTRFVRVHRAPHVRVKDTEQPRTTAASPQARFSGDALDGRGSGTDEGEELGAVGTGQWGGVGKCDDTLGDPGT